MKRLALLLLNLAATLPAQHDPHWVVPSRAVLSPRGSTPVRLASVQARIRILDRAATTTLDLELHNPSPTPQEAVVLLPVPEGAVVTTFAFEGAAPEAMAKLLPRDEARTLYDQITSSLRDPALLEFAGWRCLRSSVFPVPAHKSLRVRIGYESLLDVDGARADYVLPRTETLAQVVPWSVEVRLACQAEIGIVYSPSHELVTERKSARELAIKVAEASRREPGPFRLCYVRAGEDGRPAASLFAYPDPKVGGGYFLLLANAPASAGTPKLLREVTLVLDRSGSMAGRKIAQAKAAALHVLEGLEPGEGIQLIDFGNDVESAFSAPQRKDAKSLAAARAHLEATLPRGGTNLHDALLHALRAPVLEGTLPIVLLLTDGVPTVGPTREQDLRALVEKGNPHKRRVFCFGVGNDVNVPLLDRIAETTRATTAYVLPEEDVEAKVGRTFARLHGPVLTEPELRSDPRAGAGRLADVLPRRLGDIYAGDQLVVLGRYRGEDDLHFELTGTGGNGLSRFAFECPVRSASVKNAFVPRLWASRQIAFLVDELRQHGADLGDLRTAAADPFAQPRFKELRDEILRLSTEFGVLSEYTAVLATEGSDLGNWGSLVTACQNSLSGRAIATRSGMDAVNQGCNIWAQKEKASSNYWNAYLDEKLQRVETAAIQQICDRAFFKRGSRWIDSQSVLDQRLEPDERVTLGSARWFELVRKLEQTGNSAVLSLSGELLLRFEGKNILVTRPDGC